MKKLLIILISILFTSCISGVDILENGASYQSYFVSSKHENITGDGYIYLQTSISTQKVHLNYEDFHKIKEQDTIMVLTRYIKENE
jgi:hypothetical protein